VVSDGKQANRVWKWNSGGVLAAMADGRLTITPIRSFRLDESVREGLDQIINVRYDEETGASIVTHSDQPVIELPTTSADELDDGALEEFEATG